MLARRGYSPVATALGRLRRRGGQLFFQARRHNLGIEPSDALVEMRLADHDPADEPGPPSRFTDPTPEPAPLPPSFPPPDWEQEARERAERTAGEDGAKLSVHELEPSPKPTYPAKPKPPGRKPTPRLDKVKSWRRP